MKCIKKESRIRRVSDGDAITLVKEEGWTWCPRHEWKQKVRDKA